MRIYKEKIYLTRKCPGISGFKQYDKYEYHIMYGDRVKYHCSASEIIRQHLVNGRGVYRCEDGHLPDFQPVMKEADALHWLEENKTSIYLMNPEVYGLSKKREG